jgi:hypothetical protein
VVAAAGGPIGIAVAGVMTALTLLLSRRGPKQKVATTQIVNSVEPELEKNLNGYFSGPRTRSSQRQALANFDMGWQYVVENCGIPEMGNPGKSCISERDRGGRWDWFALYRDPIEGDNQVRPDPTIVSEAGGAISGAVESLGTIPTPLLLAGILAVAALALGGGKR